MMTGVRVDEPLVSHVLMHVRQRERRGGDSLAPKTDELLARSAWAEGEANLVAIRFLFAGMNLADEVIEEGLDPADVLDGALVPSVLGRLSGAESALVRFVYQEGFAMAAEAFRGGGWEALDRAMAARTTTRDLLHPDRPPADPAELPVAPPPQAEGLQLMDDDRLGEQAIVVLVSTLTGKDNLALQAGDGWTGDRLLRWEAASAGRTSGVTLWVTRFASPEQAADFDYAIGRTLEARFPGRPPIVLEGGERVIQTGTRVLRLRRDGHEVALQVSSLDHDALPTGGLAEGG
jgi:hypothetical protein